MACDCNNITLGNSGRPDCTLIANVTNNLIITRKFDSTGARNFIDTTATLDSTFWTDLINAGRSGATNTDSKQRIFPLPAMKNVTDERAEPITEEFGDGTIAVIRQGARSFAGEWIKRDASFTFLDKINEYGCEELAAYIIDTDGNVIGNGEDVDKLYPISIDGDSWFPNLMRATDSTIQKIMLTYNYDRNEEDANLRMITASETSVDMRDLKGLIDVNGVSSSITTTTFTLTATFDYGSQVTKTAFTGAVLADFDLNEVSPTPGAIAITSVTESADGVYDFVIPAQTSADVLELDLQKDGFEMDTVTITIP